MLNALLRAAASRNGSTSHMYILFRCMRAPSQYAPGFLLRCLEMCSELGHLPASLKSIIQLIGYLQLGRDGYYVTENVDGNKANSIFVRANTVNVHSETASTTKICFLQKPAQASHPLSLLSATLILAVPAPFLFCL